MSYDVFICHASEDKETVARPLAQALLLRGRRVWLDEFELRVGDSLRRKIDEGLRQSSFGAVILSQAFFKKPWPQWELDGLADREIAAGEVVILPIWHGVGHHEVSKYSPSLASKLAISSKAGLDEVARQIEAALVNRGRSHARLRGEIPSTEAAIRYFPAVEQLKAQVAAAESNPSGWRMANVRIVEEFLVKAQAVRLPAPLLDGFEGVRGWELDLPDEFPRSGYHPRWHGILSPRQPSGQGPSWLSWDFDHETLKRWVTGHFELDAIPRLENVSPRSMQEALMNLFPR